MRLGRELICGRAPSLLVLGTMLSDCYNRTKCLYKPYDWRGALVVTATELKKNLGSYLMRASREDILIKKNGKPVARLTGPGASRSDEMRSLFGILPKTVSVEEARRIREEEKWGL